jgi:hypothetical protein
MANQDKIIRITADTSPLRNIRQEVQGLTGDIGELARSIKAKVPSLSDLGKRIEPIIQRGVDSAFGTDEPKIERPITPAPEEYIPDPEKVRELEELSRGISEPRVSPVTEEQPVIERPEVQEEEVIPPSEPETVEEPAEPAPKKKRGRPKKTESPEEERESTESPAPKKTSGSTGSQQLAVLRQILKAVNDGNDMAVDRTTYLEELVKKGDPDDNNIIPPVIPPTPPIREEEPEEENRRSERSRREDDELYRTHYMQQGFTGIPGTLLHGALQAASSTMNARNTFEAGAGEVGAIGQTAGSLVSAGGRIAGGVAGMIPEVGPGIQAVIGGAGELAGTAISGVTSMVSAYAMRAVAKAEELESNVRSYSQTLGVSSSEAKSTALREGAFAARDLGMNAGEYLNRYAELRRAAGGKILGATDEDQEGTREIQSQLAAQRLFGINQSVLDQLQGSLRFAQRGEVEYGSSSNSPSGVIRIFENTMRDLKLPFSEIASTIEESLTTFNKTAERVLDKAGDFDAGKIATVLASVRSYTGMEGRQLERVQNAVTGSDLSEDPVTQALLMRVGREVFPEADTLSKLMAKLERPQDNPELMQKFLTTLENMTDNEEQFAQLLKSVFPKLSWNDIQGFVEVSRGDKDFKELYGSAPSPEVAAGNEKDAQYSRSAARGTVGAIEAATAEKSNRDAANGEKMLGVLASIDSKIVRLATDAGLVEKTTNAINDSLDALVKIILLSQEDNGPAWRDPKKQRTAGSALTEGHWNTVPEGTLLMNFLKKYGLD